MGYPQLLSPPVPACLVTVSGVWNTTLQSTMGAMALGTAQLDRSAWPRFGTNSLLGNAFENAGVNLTGIVLTAGAVRQGGVPPPPAPPPARPPPLLQSIDRGVVNLVRTGLDDPKRLAGLIGGVIGGVVLLLACIMCCHFHKKDQQARCASSPSSRDLLSDSSTSAWHVLSAVSRR